MDKQRDFVLRTIEERGVKFVRLWFTDVIGTLKSVAVAPAEVEGAFTEGLGFDGSAIEGLTRSYESDLLAHPDPTTFQILPWRGEIDPTARMFCDITTPDGQPAAADPRNVLKRTLAKAADRGAAGACSLPTAGPFEAPAADPPRSLHLFRRGTSLGRRHRARRTAADA